MKTRIAQFSRADLAKFIADPRVIRDFENLNFNQTDLVEAPVIGIALSDAFQNDRALAGSDDVTLVDGGAKADLSIGLSDTGVTAGTYGSQNKTVRVTVSAKGRVEAIQAFDLNTDNITEGASRLYFTNARARAALSAGPGVAYNGTTGEIKAAIAGTYGAPTGTLERLSFGTYTAPVISGPPTQSEVQAIADAVQSLSRTLAALITDMQANGNLN